MNHGRERVARPAAGREVRLQKSRRGEAGKLRASAVFLLLALVVAAVGYVWWSRGAKALLPTGVPVLCYHQFKTEPRTVYDISPAAFRGQMEYLRRNGYQVIPLSRLVEALAGGADLPEKTVVLTIDDGYQSVYQHAFPILKEYGYPATLFLYINFINYKGASLRWPQIKEMMAAGIDIGSHSFSHLKLNKGRDETEREYRRRMEKELLQSKYYLEKKLDLDIPWFSYPYGVYDLELKKMVAAYGYRAAVVLNGGVVGQGTDSYAINRKLAAGTMSEKQFARALEYRPIKTGHSYPPDGGRLHRSQLKDFRISLPDWGNRGPLRMTINGEYMNIVYKEQAGRGDLRFRSVPELRGKANCVNVLGKDKRGNRYVYSFLFWLQ